jgi:hypothetical protein
MSNTNGMQEETGGAPHLVFWRMLTSRTRSPETRALAEFCWLCAMIGGPVVGLGLGVWCLADEGERPKVADGLAKVVLALLGIFGFFGFVVVMECVEDADRRRKTAARLRNRRERAAEDRKVYGREVDPRGGFTQIERAFQRLQRERRAQRWKWVPQPGGSTGQ